MGVLVPQNELRVPSDRKRLIKVIALKGLQAHLKFNIISKYDLLSLLNLLR